MNPTLFISHGAPNIILSDSKSKRNIQKISRILDIPKYIIIISAHYVTKDLKIISPKANKIMYDFYGFEDEMYKVKYEINSDEKLTFNLIKKLKKESVSISVDETRTSYDHGVWSVLSLMYKTLEIPVLQLSVPLSFSNEELINLGEKLKIFKDEALIICSGGITHNLGDINGNFKMKSYALDFNDDVLHIIKNEKIKELVKIQTNINFCKNHPSSEHFLPLFIAFGNAFDKKGKSFNSEMMYSNISMESFIFDKNRTNEVII